MIDTSEMAIREKEIKKLSPELKKEFSVTCTIAV